MRKHSNKFVDLRSNWNGVRYIDFSIEGKEG